MGKSCSKSGYIMPSCSGGDSMTDRMDRGILNIPIIFFCFKNCGDNELFKGVFMKKYLVIIQG